MSKARRRGGKRKELSNNSEQRAQRIEVLLPLLSLVGASHFQVAPARFLCHFGTSFCLSAGKVGNS